MLLRFLQLYVTTKFGETKKMATLLTAPYAGGVVTRGDLDNFVPTLWAMEILRYRNRMFHMRAMTKFMNVIGKKGDTAHFPKVGRLGVRDRVPGTPVYGQRHVPGKYVVTITKDRESSFIIDSVAEMQSQYELRSEYTMAAAYALTQDVDNYLLGLRPVVPTSNRIFRSTGTGGGTAAGDPAEIDNATILTAMEMLLSRNVPLEECRWLFSPTQLIDLIATDKFTSKDYALADLQLGRVSSGVVGNLYGIPVHITTQVTNNSLTGLIMEDGATGEPTPGVIGSQYLPDQEDADTVVTTLPLGKTGAEVAQPFMTGGLFHPRWAMFLQQKDVTVTPSWENAFQMNLIVSTQVYGGKSFYPGEAVLIHSRGSAVIA